MSNVTDIRIVETTPIKGNASYVLVGVPDAGLVGSIAVTYIVESLSMEEVGYIDSELFPPAVTVRNGEIKNPVRIYHNSTKKKKEDSSKDTPTTSSAAPNVASPAESSSSASSIGTTTIGKDVFAIVSDIPVLQTMYVQFAKALVDLLYKMHPKLVINVSGIAVQNRQQIETPEVIGLSTSGGSSGGDSIRDSKINGGNQPRDLVSSLGIPKFSDGMLGGPYAALIKQCMTHDIPTLTLLVQAYPRFPDPTASIEALKLISKLIDEKIPLAALQKNAEMVKIKARELMRQTDEAIVENNRVERGGNIQNIYG